MAVRLARRVEQEIRAYPRLYAAFYTVLNRSTFIRRLVGNVKARVRESGSATTATLASEPLLLRRRRAAAIAARMGMQQ